MENRRSSVKLMWLLSIILIPTVAVAGVVNDYNPWSIEIPDGGPSVNSDLSMSGAPDDAIITKIDVYYEIRHPNPADLDVWLTTYYDGAWHEYILYQHGDLGSEDDIIESRYSIHAWDGASPNQTWYLVVRDNNSGEQGSIEFFELWITYNADSEPAAVAEISDISFDKSEVVPGEDTFTASIALYNSGNQAGTFFVRSSSIRDGGDTWYDWNPQQTSINLDPGQSGTVSSGWAPDESVQAGAYGLYTAVFKDSSGGDLHTDDWREPAFAIVDLPLTGSVQVTITPQGAIDAGAQWRTDGGAWQTSGATITDLSGGNHTIECKSVDNFITPSSQTVIITSGQTTSVTCHYSGINADSDDDGLPDFWEMTYFSDLTHSPGMDDDDDGISNRIEFILNTNPVVANDKEPGLYYEYDKLGRMVTIQRIPAR